MFKGNGLLSSVIKWKTGSAYSHAGIVAWWNNRLMVLEAVGKGVEAKPISFTLQHYTGEIDHFRVKSEVELSGGHRSQMVDFAQQQIGKDYAFRLLVKFFFKLLFNRELNTDDTTYPAGKYFCSHYVSSIYAQAGFDLNINLTNKFTSPDNISKSPLLEYVGKLQQG